METTFKLDGSTCVRAGKTRVQAGRVATREAAVRAVEGYRAGHVS